MKKFLSILTVSIMLGFSCVLAQGENTYSPAYIQHLKNCSAYTDEYTANIPTQDENSPYLKVKSTEQILGWINGKCVIKSTVHSVDLDQKIMVIKCNLSREQLISMMDKMKTVNSAGSLESKQAFSDEMVRIIEDGTTCRVKNYLTE